LTYIIAEMCIGVRDTSCVAVDPVEAIFPGEKVPETWHELIRKGYEHFGLTAP